jgi:CDP-diacylglycerol--glycerol-3-phosphate 3-phosphatidyltransferase
VLAPARPALAGAEPGATFGPSALATPANAVTAARLLAAPVMVALVARFGATWPLFAGWVAVSGSDGIDGYVARRHGSTRSGAFLDPLADKAAVLGTLGALAARGTVPWLPVALIGAREAVMSAYRVRAGRRGVSVPARRSAKVKTWCQDLAVGLALLPPLEGRLATLPVVALWLAVALTLASGAQYASDVRARRGRLAEGTASCATGPP